MPLNLPAILVLEDGTVFEGQSVGAGGLSVGEVVFNTAMTGYQEVLTDPSYAQQLVTLTYPHIGNTGCTPQDDESARAWAAGLIVRDVPRRPSSWRSKAALPDWLQAQGVVAIAGIDTRKLTRLLRERGSMGGAILAAAAPDEALDVEHGEIFDTMDTALRAAEAGRGFAIGDLSMIGDDIGLGRLVAPFNIVTGGVDNLYLVRRDRIRPKPEVTRFVEWLYAQVEEMNEAG